MNLQLTPTISNDVDYYKFTFTNHDGIVETTQWIPRAERHVLRRAMDGGSYQIKLIARNSTSGQTTTAAKHVSMGQYPIPDEITTEVSDEKEEPTIFQNFFNPIFDWLGQRDSGQILFILLIAIIILWHSLFRGKEKKKVKIYNARKVL